MKLGATGASTMCVIRLGDTKNNLASMDKRSLVQGLVREIVRIIHTRSDLLSARIIGEGYDPKHTARWVLWIETIHRPRFYAWIKAFHLDSDSWLDESEVDSAEGPKNMKSGYCIVGGIIRNEKVYNL